MFEIAGGILIAVFVLVLLPYIIVAAAWLAVILTIIGVVATLIHYDAYEVGIIMVIVSIVVTIYAHFEKKDNDANRIDFGKGGSA